MRAFFLKVIAFFRTVISTLCNKKSLRVAIDSNHDGKPDITIDYQGLTNQPEIHNRSED